MATFRISLVADLDGNEEDADHLYMALTEVLDRYNAVEQDLHGENVQDITWQGEQ